MPGEEIGKQARRDQLPFAGMIRIRFQGSKPQVSSQPLNCDSPSDVSAITRIDRAV